MRRSLLTASSLLAAWAMLAAVSAACSSDDSAPSGPGNTSDGGTETDAPLTTDPFCRGRPLLPFCEDFDDRPLPGAFAEIAGDPSLLKIGDDGTAPSPPKVLGIARTAGSAGSVWLRTPRMKRSAKANAFFRVRFETIGDDVEIAAFVEENGHRVAMVVAKDGTVGVREPDAFIDAGSDADGDGGADAGAQATRMSTVKIEMGAWASVRWDIRFVGGVARTRLRVGSATAFDAENLGLTGTDAAEHMEIGVQTAAGATGALGLAFDSVTFEPDAE